MPTATILPAQFPTGGCVRQTMVIHSRLAWRHERVQAAVTNAHGLQALPIEALAARLAGGFLQPIDPDALKAAITDALSADLGEIERIKDLPGFGRAAVATLSKAWSAGLDLAQLAADANPEAAARLAAVARLEAEVLRRLPAAMCRPADLVTAARQRISVARTLFGRIEIHGRTEMSPVWRPLVGALAHETELLWVAGPRYVPDWVREHGITIAEAPPEAPEIRAESCASPRHEALEAIRWARELIATRQARPEEIAIAAASPDEWDDHFVALGTMSGLDLHFVHGRKVLTTPGGQAAAALAEVLLRGFSQMRVRRLVSLLRTEGRLLTGLPPNWGRALSTEAPLLDAERWRQVLSAITPQSFSDGVNHAPALREVVDILARGLKQAAEIGELLLNGRALAIWRKALIEGHPQALDVALTSLRQPDDIPPETAIIWASGAAVAAVPRPFVRLIGLISRAWPRRASEDPLLPDHIVPARRLEPLPVHIADRRDFDTIRHTTSRQLCCSRSRRDAEGRLNGISPLYPAHAPELHRQRARLPHHAAGWSDRLFARPAEFEASPQSQSATACWIDWHSERLTPHDGLMRQDHSVVTHALRRQQSATSLAKLLRDPLGYLWQYAFHWRQPSETEDPLVLDPLSFGTLVHATLQAAVTILEGSGGFASARPVDLDTALDTALTVVAADWEQSQPSPPPVIWQRKLQDIRDLARAALTFSEDPLPGQRSCAEIPFGGDRRASDLAPENRARLPWDPMAPVIIPGTTLQIAGSIDRLDLAADGETARVTDYKSGRPPSQSKDFVLKGGAELQRCLYGFAVRSLLSNAGTIASRLLYLKAADGGLYSLADPEGVLASVAGFAAAASRSAAKGNLLPGPDAAGAYNDFAFALPGGGSGTYFDLKTPLIAARLRDLVPLWEMA
jgi:PD-(D/E)XK nuclease superfamily